VLYELLRLFQEATTRLGTSNRSGENTASVSRSRSCSLVDQFEATWVLRPSARFLISVTVASSSAETLIAKPLPAEVTLTCAHSRRRAFTSPFPALREPWRRHAPRDNRLPAVAARSYPAACGEMTVEPTHHGAADQQ
jgi:hypothetical protein